ncbi:MAG: DUF327 family protein [Treponema sp.]|jgi:uncharacterized protein YaaR (DUF327 family)|nr:DUF327 family protein [Treponema sp.]
MDNIVFPDGSSPLFNPAAYGEAAAEARRAKPGGPDKTGKSRKSAGKDGVKKKNFASFFETPALPRELPLSEDSLHELLDTVHSAGDALAGRPFPPEIKAYKEAVRNFVHYVVENGFDTEEQTSSVNISREKIGGANIVKRKKYTLVQVIDKKLEELAAGILRGQIQQLEILAKQEEIKGLLVDLMQ